MKRVFPFLGFLLLWSSLAPAQSQPDSTPATPSLIDCGNEKVATFDRTTSKDGHYAVGWTLRPKGQQPPVDWSLYKPDERGAFEEKHSFDDPDESKNVYTLVDGVLDLTAKKFTPLPGKAPYYPGENRAGLSASWSDEQQGSRAGLVALDGRFGTVELWLAAIDTQGVRVHNLSPEADKAVGEYMRKRDPKDAKQYVFSYNLDATEEANGKPPVFKEGSVTLHFDAGIPKSTQNGDDGFITLSLPEGKVIGVRKK